MQYRSVYILGRQPAIGRAELESLFGAEALLPLGDAVVASNIAPADAPFARLGSVVKLGEYLGTIQATDWRTVQQHASELALQRAKTLGEGKLQLGISVYGLHVSPKQLTGAGLELKKQLRKLGRSVRLVPNQEAALSSAQVLHNHLAGERGLELLLIRHGSHVLVARTTAVQDITAYARRDQGRPKRDARVGMLPPKLAQTIVNLGVGTLPPSPATTVLDPFCGTGVVLQEALLMGYGVYGTDLEPRMIDYSRENLTWLSTMSTDKGWQLMGQHPPRAQQSEHEEGANELTGPRAATSQDESVEVEAQLEVGDATTHQWQPVPAVVAGETYLGRPLSSWPTPEKLQEIIGTCNVILERFLSNIGRQLPSGTRLCLAVPAWINPSGAIKHLPLLDRLSDLGYNRVSFSGVRNEDLVYYRPDQFVGRELLVIIRK